MLLSVCTQVLCMILWHIIVTGEDSWDYDQLVFEFRSKCSRLKLAYLGKKDLMANNESLDERQNKLQWKKDNLGSIVLLCSATKQTQTEWAFIIFQQMKIWDDSGLLLCDLKENQVFGCWGPATSAALILQPSLVQTNCKLRKSFQWNVLLVLGLRVLGPLLLHLAVNMSHFLSLSVKLYNSY